MIRFTAGDDDAGERIDLVVARRAATPRTAVQRALRSGDLTVDARVVRPSYLLEAGDVVAGRVPATEHPAPEADEIPVAVRYSDERVLVVSKPAGLVTHPAPGHERATLVNALIALGEPLAAAGSDRPGIVHRLDKETSGLLLVAKDDDAHASLARALKERRVRRSYLALVRGKPAVGSGTVEAPIGRHPARRWAMAVVPGGRPAVTHYRVLGGDERVSLLEVTLETGRTHQIRVHLAHLGHPVLGDAPYGGAGDLARGLGLGRPFLHAWRLSFPHPDDERTVEVSDAIPEDLVAALESAGIEPPR